MYTNTSIIQKFKLKPFWIKNKCPLKHSNIHFNQFCWCYSRPNIPTVYHMDIQNVCGEKIIILVFPTTILI